MKQTNREFTQKILLVCLFAIGIFFSLYKLKESPSVWYDEGWYIQTSMNWGSTGIDGIQLAPGNILHVSILTVCYPILLPLAGWLQIFGTSIVAARSLMVIFILAFLLAAYVLARRLFGTSAALGSVALLVTFPPLYANGKSVLGEVPGLFYLSVFLLCLTQARAAEPSRKSWWYVITGIFAGLCATTKPVYLLILPAILLGLFIARKTSGMTLKNIGIGALGVAIPVIVWFFIQFPPGTSSSNVLTFYANPYDVNMVQIVLENLRRLFTDFSTLYTVFIVLAWGIALFVRRRMKEAVTVQEIIAFCFSALVMIAFLRTGGLYRYLFYAQGMALIFLPNALVVCSRYFLKRFGERVSEYAPYALITLLCVLGLYQTMFNSWVADSYGSHKTAYWENYFAALPASTTAFFYDTPEIVPFISGTNYHQFLKAPAGSSTGSEQLAVIRDRKADLIFVQTNAFEANEGGIFDGYAVQETPYKYSILTRKP